MGEMIDRIVEIEQLKVRLKTYNKKISALCTKKDVVSEKIADLKVDDKYCEYGLYINRNKDVEIQCKKCLSVNIMAADYKDYDILILKENMKYCLNCGRKISKINHFDIDVNGNLIR